MPTLTLVPPETARQTPIQSDRVRIFPVSESDEARQIRDDVRNGLSKPSGQRSIPPMYFYDDAGSRLFDAITQLPEYYPTRAEQAILDDVAPLLAMEIGPVELVELGSGSSRKTRTLLEAWLTMGYGIHYVPIDISATALSDAADNLSKTYPSLHITGLAGRYEDALDVLGPAETRMIAFLGSTLGNFDDASQDAFLKMLSAQMAAGHLLLLGYDRHASAEKPQDVIEAAYNDELGITVQFNRNMLFHLNARLDADFDVTRWKHDAPYNAEAEQIEMTLESVGAQTVTLGALEMTVEFADGERILTEISRKFDPAKLEERFATYGFNVRHNWLDTEGQFGLALFEKR